jgi:hypothetical protein
MVLKLRYDSPKGWVDAKCVNVLTNRENDPFFSEEEEERQDALDLCNGAADGVICPMRQECLIFALTNNEKYGIWGGSSEVTRRAIRKRYPPHKGNQPREEWQQWTSEKDILKELKTDLPNQDLEEDE